MDAAKTLPCIPPTSGRVEACRPALVCAWRFTVCGLGFRAAGMLKSEEGTSCHELILEVTRAHTHTHTRTRARAHMTRICHIMEFKQGASRRHAYVAPTLTKVHEKLLVQ